MGSKPRFTERAREVIRVGDESYVLAVVARADDRTRVLKHGETFAVFDRHGDIRNFGHGDHGLYHAGNRHLSWLELTLDGLRPLLLSSTLDPENLVLAVDLTNPDLSTNGEIELPRGTVHLRRQAFIWEDALHERLEVQHFGTTPARLHLALRVGADFADIFEVRGVPRERRGTLGEFCASAGEVCVEYAGLDGVRRETRIVSAPGAEAFNGERLHWDVELEARRSTTIEWAVRCENGTRAGATPAYGRALATARERTVTMRDRQCEIDTSNRAFDDWLERSRADLRLMITDTAHGPYPYAGIPWFSSPFGRDGIITALQTLWLDPTIARGVLTFLSETQAVAANPAIDAEPGKIVHEMRGSEMAATGEVPFGRYYGSADGTPLFVLLAGEYFRATADTELIERIWPNVLAALQWINAAADEDGFVRYQRRAGNGLANQGWKDSRDSVFHADGVLAEPPIALCEIQGYVYAARRAVAEIAAARGDLGIAEAQRARADALRSRFAERFWDERLGLYVLALDGRQQACRVAASNAGHCLYTGIAAAEHASRIVAALTGPRFFNGWGIRTVADDQPRYNPMSYHNGSVWPHDTALAAAGMARYGHPTAAALLLNAMFEVADSAELHRLPELFCGFARQPDEAPVRYPVACSPQAWSAATVFQMLGACLGLDIDARERVVRCQTPVLPACLTHVLVRGIRIGAARLDLAFEQGAEAVKVHVLRCDPGIRFVASGVPDRA